MQRRSVVGTRSSLLWLLILIALIFLAGLVMIGLVVLPQLQATRAEQARLAEVERHYQAGVAFQSVNDWAAAEDKYKQVIALDASYKDVQARFAAVRDKLREIATTATAVAVAQAERMQAEATATARAAPSFTTVEVAGGKPVTASGYWKGSASSHIFPPKNVVNRKTDESKEDCGPGPRTYWLLPDRSTGWVQVDLQQNYCIVKLRWLNTHNGICGDRATTRLRIAVSTSGRYEGEEQTVYSGSMAFSRTPAFQEFLLPPTVVARYVRFYVEDYYNWGGGLNEVEVYALAPVP